MSRIGGTIKKKVTSFPADLRSTAPFPPPECPRPSDWQFCRCRRDWTRWI